MPSATLERVINNKRGKFEEASFKAINLKDGGWISVQARLESEDGVRNYSTFDPSLRKFTELEVALPREAEVPEQLVPYDERYHKGLRVFGWVPSDIVRSYIDEHGGESRNRAIKKAPAA